MKAKVILLSGKARSGKNTVGEFLHKMYTNLNENVTSTYFAKNLKETCRDVFNPLIQYINKHVDDIVENLMNIDDTSLTLTQRLAIKEKLITNVLKLKTQEHNWFEDKNDITMLLLTSIGTDLIRDKIDPQWWVKKSHEDIKRLIQEENKQTILVTDFRFPNEYHYLKENSEDLYELYSINIYRPNLEDSVRSNHKSETALKKWNHDFVVKNDRTLLELENQTADLAININNEHNKRCNF